jgi:hypothetical protein
MTYGQKLSRQENAVKITMQQQRGKRDGKMDMDMLQHASTVFDFQCCVVDHNLDDAKGVKLNLTQQHVIDSLDPRVGEEISQHIDKMNNFEDELDAADFPNGSVPQLSSAVTQIETSPLPSS